MEKLFSIVTVTWNAAGVIAPTISGIKDQTFTDFEWLVVDGASKDDTVRLAQEAAVPNMRIVSERDKGLYDAMNKAIRLAHGKYLIWLNAGDSFADAQALQRLADAAVGNPGVIYGQTQLVDESRRVVGMRHLTAPKHLTVDSFKRGMLVCHQAFVARRDIAPQYNLTYRFSADFDWCIRVLKASTANAYAGDKPVISFLTDGMTDKNSKASLKERFRIMCQYYGTVPTVLRHISFVPRFVLNKLRRAAAKKRRNV